MRFWREHSLSICLILIYLSFQIAAFLAFSGGNDYLQAMFQGHSDDTLGAILIVLFTKWFRERNSHESD